MHVCVPVAVKLLMYHFLVSLLIHRYVLFFSSFSVDVGGPLNLYSDQNICLRYGITNDGHRDQCPEGIASFLALLESIPIYNVGSDYGSNEHTVPYSRYICTQIYSFLNDLSYPLDIHYFCKKKKDKQRPTRVNCGQL